MERTVEQLKERIRAGGARIPAEKVIKNGQLVNVMTSEIYPAEIAIYKDMIAAVGDEAEIADYIGSDTEIIDRRLDKVAIVAFVGAFLSFIGIIHSAAITINVTNQWGIGYLITGVVCLILHFGRNSWCKPDEDMLEYIDDQSGK